MPSEACLRVLTYNVAALAGDRSALRRVVRSARPDVVCWQELPCHPFSGHRIGALAGGLSQWLAAAGGGAAGVGITTALSVDVRAAQSGALPVPCWRGRRPVRRRGYAIARVRSPVGPGWSRPVTVLAAHLGLDEGERLQHVGILLARLAEDGTGGDGDAPALRVLAGDLNEPPTGPSGARFGATLLDAARVVPGVGGQPSAPQPTFPARAPRQRIDAIWVDPRIEVRWCGVPPRAAPADLAAASDHLPVLAELALPAPFSSAGVVDPNAVAPG